MCLLCIMYKTNIFCSDGMLACLYAYTFVKPYGNGPYCFTFFLSQDLLSELTPQKTKDSYNTDCRNDSGDVAFAHLRYFIWTPKRTPGSAGGIQKPMAWKRAKKKKSPS